MATGNDNMPGINRIGRARTNLGGDKHMALALRNEKGFIEIQILLTYMVFILTIFTFILGLAFGVWKEASAKYMYFAESMDFASRAANITGELDEVMLNQNRARQYFSNAMQLTGGDYALKSFYTVAPGQAVPRGTARAPGYVAEIIVPVFNAQVPLIGRQWVNIPMRYYAVVESPVNP